MKNNTTNSYKHTLKYAGLFGGVQGLNLMIGLIRNKLVALILGPAGMGLVSLYNSTITLMSNTTNFGLSMSGVKRISEYYDEYNDSTTLSENVRLIRSLCIVAAILGILLCSVLSGQLSLWTFGNYEETMGFIMLSPMVGMLAVIAGELAIMKGVRMLKPLAVISIFNVVAAVVISVPIFYIYGRNGIIPSFLLLTLSQLIFTLRYSYKRFPLRLSFSVKFLSRGWNIIKLGFAFVVAGVFGSGADFLIRLFLNNCGSLDTVGLYNSGFVMTMVYGGLVFSAMETDYFPRLSAVAHGNIIEQNNVVNNQVEVSLLLVSPMLTAFITFLPIILPLLFSHKFVAVLPMVQVTVLALYMRAMKLPLAYIALSKSDSKCFLLLELTYAVVFLILVCGFFKLFGLTGTGYGILITAIFDFIVLTIFTYFRYKYVISKTVFVISIIQLPLGIASYIASQVLHGWLYWLIGAFISFLSLSYSVYIFHSKTHLLSSIKNKFGKIKS